MPANLTEEAKAEWRRVVPELERLGTLTKLDRGLLIRYCTAWADWVDLDAQVAKTGRLVKGRDGNFVRNPLWLLRRDAERSATDLGRQLGLTPDARVRAGVKHERRASDEQAPPGVKAIADYRTRLAGS
jgi:P27 family predicted phage terminase small subunit